MNNTKECYQCKSIIRADALICPHCGKDPNKSSAMVKGIISLITFVVIAICLISFISFQVKNNKPSERCQPATAQQLDFINYAVAEIQDTNYIKDGYAVKSNDFQNVYMVAVMLYGPGMEDGTGPVVFAVAGDPDQPHTWLAVDGYAKNFTDLPDAGNTDAMITLSSDGVEEVISCYK